MHIIVIKKLLRFELVLSRNYLKIEIIYFPNNFLLNGKIVVVIFLNTTPRLYYYV